MIVTQAFTTTGSSPVFTPRAGSKTGFNVSLGGTFVATVGLYRTLPGDAGAWRLVTSYTAPVETSMVEYENGASYQWQCTNYTSGTANARLGQSL